LDEVLDQVDWIEMLSPRFELPGFYFGKIEDAFDQSEQKLSVTSNHRRCRKRASGCH